MQLCFVDEVVLLIPKADLYFFLETLEHTEWVPPGPHYDFLAMIDKMEADGAQAETLDDDYWYQGGWPDSDCFNSFSFSSVTLFTQLVLL